jgi:DNA-binding transcriptional LysR family regulator
MLLWRGVVPDSFRRFRQRQPDAELQLSPLTSLEQIETVRAGRLDAGFVLNLAKADRELDQLPVAMQQVELAVPKGHRLSKSKKLRLRDLVGASFVWFPRRESSAFYDRLMQKCSRGGLKSPLIVQEALNEATILSLVSQGMGVGWVSGNTRWRCPEGAVILPISDLDMPLPLSLVWRRDNSSPLLARFVADTRLLRVVQKLT